MLNSVPHCWHIFDVAPSNGHLSIVPYCITIYCISLEISTLSVKNADFVLSTTVI